MALSNIVLSRCLALLSICPSDQSIEFEGEVRGQILHDILNLYAISL